MAQPRKTGDPTQGISILKRKNERLTLNRQTIVDFICAMVSREVFGIFYPEFYNKGVGFKNDSNHRQRFA